MEFIIYCFLHDLLVYVMKLGILHARVFANCDVCLYARCAVVLLKVDERNVPVLLLQILIVLYFILG